MQVSLHLAERYVRVWAEQMGEKDKEDWSLLSIETNTEQIKIHLPRGHAQIIAKAWPDLEVSDTERNA